MKKILLFLFEYKTLSREMAADVMRNIAGGDYSETEITSFATVFLMRSITIEELLGFRDALMELCIRVQIENAETLDIVGTGGDNKNTFNISTLSAFIIAGAGQPVAKHGNYGATSISGSSNVMEQLGYKFKSDNSRLNNEIEKAGICFLHAPVFHPALKVVGALRKNLGIRTFFNMLGPLINPAQPAFQVLGVYSLEMARMYNYILQETGLSFIIFHSLDGYDEISLTADVKVISKEGEKIMTPEMLGKRTVDPKEIYGGNSVENSADIFLTVLKREGTWSQNAVVLANAALALSLTGKFEKYNDAYDAAVESLESGKAFQSFKKLIELQG
ncbi:MAG: anthranilate phosphoribosyltransferase [Chitinophagaceae bacterium]